MPVPHPEPSDDASEELARVVSLNAIGHDGGSESADWARHLGRLAGALARSARTAGIRGVTGGRWLAGVLVEAAPRLPIRTRPALRSQYGDLSDDEIADELIAAATRTTAAIGAAAGALAAVEFVAPPTLLAAPVQVMAETIAVAAVEVRLLAELHELYAAPVPIPPGERAMAYLIGWSQQRGIRPMSASSPAALRQIALRRLRPRLLRRAGRNVTTMAPFFIGAVAGAEVNRRATRELGRSLLQDLR